VSAALHELSACPAAPDETFDRLAQLTAKAVGAPAAFVSLADCAADEIVFTGITGLPEIAAGQRLTLSETICRHVVESGAPLAIGDTRSHPLARDEASLHELGIAAYLGVPLRAESGDVIGVLCSVDRFARSWSDAQVEIAQGLAAAVMTELELRSTERRYRSLIENIPLATYMNTVEEPLATFYMSPHLGFLLDVTEHKQLEEQLRQSQKMDAVGQLAGGIAHDFNNMLTAISGYADLLASSFEPADPRADDVEQIRKAAGHAAVLTRQLLSFSRKQVLLPQRLDVNEVVGGLEGMLTRTLGGHVRLVTELEGRVAPVEADPDQLAQVVVNIALNGRDAMPDGGSLTIATGTVERESRSYVAVEVTDTGTGMDEETRSRVFEPFFTTKDKGKGTGLGLATAYGVVDQSGGRIEVESAPGAGSTFRVLLPAA